MACSCDGQNRLSLLAFPSIFLDVSQLEQASPWAKQYAAVMGSVFFCGPNSGFVAIGLQDAGEDRQMHLGMLASSVDRGTMDHCRPREPGERPVVALS
ncbi:hypothetical protein XH99_00130 [Bradyrhizobium nanningense]|uniref:Uncharacterized protein n=1 Tax=Bradyrhizobium nanningense TaxID=1325118 RepID=A0A4Q0SL12_9BRAD|nr:hypothetical protein XH99_00130 [Bradyrhizobium nanningense]